MNIIFEHHNVADETAIGLYIYPLKDNNGTCGYKQTFGSIWVKHDMDDQWCELHDLSLLKPGYRKLPTKHRYIALSVRNNTGKDCDVEKVVPLFKGVAQGMIDHADSEPVNSNNERKES